MSNSGPASVPIPTSMPTARASPYSELQHSTAACTAAETSDHHTTFSPTNRLVCDDIAHAYRERLTATRHT